MVVVADTGIVAVAVVAVAVAVVVVHPNRIVDEHLHSKLVVGAVYSQQQLSVLDYTLQVESNRSGCVY